MATINNNRFATHEEFANHIGSLEDAELVAQQLVQQGAINAIGFLMKTGCTETMVAAMMASLRENDRLIKEEAKRRGKIILFTDDQTGFS